MADLTQEQVVQAWNAFCDGNRGLEGLRAAAPFLQLPWDEPTAGEMFAARLSLCNTINAGKPWETDEIVAKEFVRLRNAALPPKPVDPRREALVRALMMHKDLLSAGFPPEALVTSILNALNEAK